MEANLCGKFSMNRPEDETASSVAGILALNDKIIISDYYNHMLKLYDQNGAFLSSVDSKHDVRAMTGVESNTFASCGKDWKIRLWKACDEAVVSEDISYDLDHDPESVYCNGTYYSVLCSKKDNCAITVLDINGSKVRKIIIKKAFGKTIEFGCDIHMDGATHNIYVPCVIYNFGVLCVSVESEILWFSPLPREPKRIIELEGRLCVTCFRSENLHLISKVGKYESKVMENDGYLSEPYYISYQQSARKLLIGFCQNDSVHVFAIK